MKQGRPVMLSNGSLVVGLDNYGLVHDFYYPNVGLDNLTNARSMRHKVGVWVNGQFSWLDDGSWAIKVNFREDALVSDISAENSTLGVELTFSDFVDTQVNAFCRRITINNKTDIDSDIRLFIHQVFQISRAGRADTAMFVPDDNYILDYKGRCALLIYGQGGDNNEPLDQFAIGNYGIEGKEGTYRDAEDGELSNNPVEHGGVDTVLRFSCPLRAHTTGSVDYWIIAADSQFTAEKIHHQFLGDGIDKRLSETVEHWHKWMATAEKTLAEVDDAYKTMARKSLMVIKAHCDRRGGVVASCDSSIYNYGRDYYSYVWPRDAAYAMWPLIRLGYRDEPRRMFEFCRDILTPEGYLMHKYQPDRAIGSTWHPLLHGKRRELAIQEDETAIIVFMLGEYYRYSEDRDFVYGLYTTLVQPAANFMSSFIDTTTKLPHASYDLWEEQFLTSTYTTAVVYQALLTAAEFAEEFEYPDDAVKWRNTAQSILENSRMLFSDSRNSFRKGLLLMEDGSIQFNDRLDVSSLYGSMMYWAQDIGVDLVKETLHTMEATLLDSTPTGGSGRYEHDYYFAVNQQYFGNPWHITTLWFAQYYIRTKELDKAKKYIDWVIDRAQPSGVLAEQVNPETGEPVSVMPLVWSHAELINTVLDLGKVSKP